MLTSDLDLLRCVDCGGHVTLTTPAPDDVVVNGVLACPACGRSDPVVDGVAVMFRRDGALDFLTAREVARMRELGWDACLDGIARTRADVHARQVAVMENWAYQWDEIAGWTEGDYSRDAGLTGARAFWNFIPIDPASVAGKRVLVACGGLGREAYHLLVAGADKVIVNEIGHEIYRMASTLPDAARRCVLIRSDACALPVRSDAVHLAVCDHALQHVPAYKQAFGELVRVVEPAGAVAVCVYSWENNGLMTHGVEPMKALVHRLPLKAQRLLAWPVAALLYAVIHGIYRTAARLSPSAAKRLPLFDHMMFWSENDLRTVWLSVFDLIHAPTSRHFRRQELEQLAAVHALTLSALINTNSTLWSMVARKHT